jgi:hypothetical protein
VAIRGSISCLFQVGVMRIRSLALLGALQAALVGTSATAAQETLRLLKVTKRAA